MAQPMAIEGRVRDYVTRPRLVAILAALVVLVLGSYVAASQQSPSSGRQSNETFNGMVLSPPQPLPALELDRADGGRWSIGDSGEDYALFFFGYTHCPDVCPMTLSRASQIRDALGTEPNRVAFYFVTVDPERDTPERLANYTQAFDPAIVGLTGSHDELSAAHEAFGVQAQKQEIAGATSYAVDHTATSYLVDGEGRIKLMYTHDAPTTEIVEDLKRLIQQS